MFWNSLYYTAKVPFLVGASLRHSASLCTHFTHSFMHVEHFEKGLRYNDQDLILLAKKIGRLATYCKKLKDAGSWIRVEAERRDTKKANDQTKVMITVHLPKKMLRVESRKLKALDAVDSCVEKLEEQIKRYKEMNSGREVARKAKKVRGM